MSRPVDRGLGGGATAAAMDLVPSTGRLAELAAKNARNGPHRFKAPDGRAAQRGRFSIWTAARRPERIAPWTVDGYWLWVASPAKNSLSPTGLAIFR